MAQLNVEIDDALLKRIKYACVDHKIKLKALVSAALEAALMDIAAAPDREPPIEIIETPPSRTAERVKKA